MKKPKQIQISENFLHGVSIVLGILKSNPDTLESIENFLERESTKKIIKVLQDEIDAKFDAMERRESYTKYKTSKPNTKERENARKEYLKKVYISDDFTSKNEIPNP